MQRTEATDINAERLDGLNALVGTTPLLEIHYRYRGSKRRIYAKYEVMNMTSYGRVPVVGMSA